MGLKLSVVWYISEILSVAKKTFLFWMWQLVERRDEPMTSQSIESNVPRVCC